LIIKHVLSAKLTSLQLNSPRVNVGKLSCKRPI